MLSPLMLSQPPGWADPCAEPALNLLQSQNPQGLCCGAGWTPGAPGRAVLLPGCPARIWVLSPTSNPVSSWLGSGAAGSTGSTRMRRAMPLVARPRPAGTSGSIHRASWDFPLGILAELHGAPPYILPSVPSAAFSFSFPGFFVIFFFPLFAFHERPVKGWVGFVTNMRSHHWHGPLKTSPIAPKSPGN